MPVLFSVQQKVALSVAASLGIGFISLITIAVPSHVNSKVKVRNIWHLYNLLVSSKSNSDDLHDLHEEVLQEELEAFADKGSVVQAKRSLWDMQVEGAFERPGNLFTSLGHLIFKKDLALRLARRLRFARFVKENGEGPSNSSIDTSRPIIIVGLPRTGSTMISRLLSADPDSRSPLYWEFAHDSDDVSPSSNPSSDPRASPVESGFSKLSIFSPNGLSEFKKFHNVSAFEHEEVTGFTRRFFFDMETALLSPDAQDERLGWQKNKHVDRSFLASYLRVWLRHQERGSEGEFWVLKSPAVTSWLEEYHEAFPNAVFVFTSRDPKSVVPSLCGLNEVALSLKYDYGHPTRGGMSPIGEGVIGRVAGYAKAQGEFIEKYPDSCINIPYKDMVKNPIGSAREIYKFAGREMTGEIEGRMREHAASNKKGKHGKAEYSLEKFGLTASQVDSSFPGYESYYN